MDQRGGKEGSPWLGGYPALFIIELGGTIQFKGHYPHTDILLDLHRIGPLINKRF